MKIVIKLFLMLSFVFSSVGFANEHSTLDKAPIDLKDQASLQRGAKTFINYCLNCHSANYMRYNRLKDIGLSDNLIKENLLFTAEKVGEPMKIAMTKKDAKAWFGATPPDLSVEVRARGSDWVYSYLRGYYRDSSTPSGWNNTVFEKTAMPHILWKLQGDQKLNEEHHTLEIVKPGMLSVKEYDAFVGDLVNYLTFMSEPSKLKRLDMGYYVLLFLGLLLVLTVKLKKEFWKDIK